MHIPRRIEATAEVNGVRTGNERSRSRSERSVTRGRTFHVQTRTFRIPKVNVPAPGDQHSECEGERSSSEGEPFTARAQRSPWSRERDRTNEEATNSTAESRTTPGAPGLRPKATRQCLTSTRHFAALTLTSRSGECSISRQERCFTRDEQGFARPDRDLRPRRACYADRLVVF